jgi:hypothetical protein
LSVIPAFKRLRQEDCELKDSLGSHRLPCLEKSERMEIFYAKRN